MQVYFYDGSITCFQSSHLGVSIFATIGVVLVIFFPVLILIISFRTYKVIGLIYHVILIAMATARAIFSLPNHLPMC